MNTTTDAELENRAGRGDALRLMAYPLFFASGMAGLTYEIVWTRMLIYVFGAGIYAVTAVLAAFMAGLALGSIAFGRMADRMERPIRFYGILEILIAAAGIALPLILDRLDVVNAWVYGRFGQNFAALTTARFVVTFGLLLVPTTLMGATLPILSRAMVRHGRHLGARVGELYALNTFGALSGAFLAGFYLIERFGVYQTALVAAGLNAVAAAGAILISLRIERKSPAAPLQNETPIETEVAPLPMASPDEQAAQAGAAPIAGLDRRQVALIMFAVFMTGVVALGAQVLWFRSLVFTFEYLKNTTYAFSAMLTVFLAGLALGSAVIGLAVDRLRNPMRFYGLLLILLAVSMAFSVTVLYNDAYLGLLPDPFSDPETQAFNWRQAVVNIMAQSTFVLGLPTLLMGMAFPVAVRAVATARRVGVQVGALYALNTTGAIVGALAACFLVVPWFGLSHGLFFLAAVDGLIGLALIAKAPESSGHLYVAAPASAFIFLVAILSTPLDRGMQPLAPRDKLIHYDEGPLATIAVVENSFGYRTLNIDGVGVAGTDPMLQTDQKSLAHMPMFLVDDPKAALTVGFGSGGASYSYLLHDRLETVHCVEIVREVTEAAPYLSDANHNFLKQNDPRYRLVFEDVRAYLQYTDQTYDIIATDATDLRYKSNANLYDLEYFQFCREKLRPGGVVVVWMPLGGLSVEVFKIALRTFHEIFPEMGVFFMNNEPTHYILLVGWRDEMKIDYRLFEERLREDDVRADLEEIHLGDPVKLLSTFITGGGVMEEYLAGDTLNTEDHPVIEFLSPKYGYADQPILDNLASLMEIRRSPREFLVEGSMTPEEKARLVRFEAALPHIVEGHAHYRQLEIEEATRSYMKARQLAPTDPSLDYLLDFRELRLAAALGSPWHALMLGRAFMLQERLDDAATVLTRARQIIIGQGGPNNEFEAGLMRRAAEWREQMRDMLREKLKKERQSDD